MGFRSSRLTYRHLERRLRTALRFSLWLIVVYLLIGVTWLATALRPHLLGTDTRMLLYVLTGGVLGTMVVVQFERIRRTRALEQQEARFHAMVQHATDLIAIVDAAGVIQYQSPSVAAVLGFTPADLQGRNVLELIHPEDAPRAQSLMAAAIRQPGQKISGELRARRCDGSWANLEVTGASFLDLPELRGIVVNSRDVSLRRHAEEDRRQLELEFTRLVNNANDMIVIYEPLTGQITFPNTKFCQVTGYTPEELAQLQLRTLVHPDDHPAISDRRARRLRGEPVPWEVECRLVSKTGQVIPTAYSVTLVDTGGRLSGAQLIARDISERKQAEREIRDQLDRLAALHAIDLAITGSLDVPRTVEIALDHIVAQPDVDAVTVLQFDPVREALTSIASLGLPESAITRAPFPAYDGLAGSAVLDRRVVSIANLAQYVRHSGRARRFAEAEFVGYHGVPLIAHGQIHGVLEILQREPTTLTPAWLEFVQMLGDRLAVAMGHAELFAGLQRSNRELTHAHEALLDGWARALELRDDDTQGHSQRVTALAVDLARALDLSEDAIEHLRRGALLHDIGKIGIPDRILLKPGPLTETEWAIMRQHPHYAEQLLAPIPFLRPAMEIPRWHHEKWDGSGYPDRPERGRDPAGGPHLRRGRCVGRSDQRPALPHGLVGRTGRGLPTGAGGASLRPTRGRRVPRPSGWRRSGIPRSTRTRTACLVLQRQFCGIDCGRVIEDCQDLRPEASCAPLLITRVDCVPGSELRGHLTPRSHHPHDPEHARQQAAVLVDRTPGARWWRKHGGDARPAGDGQFGERPGQSMDRRAIGVW